MNNLKRWTKIMDSYYTGLSTNYLEGDLKNAGFQVNTSSVKSEINNEFILGELRVTMRQTAASTNNDSEEGITTRLAIRQEKKNNSELDVS